MKKFLFWILTFLWIWLSFCSAEFSSISFEYVSKWPNSSFIFNGGCIRSSNSACMQELVYSSDSSYLVPSQSSLNNSSVLCSSSSWISLIQITNWTWCTYYIYSFSEFSSVFWWGWSSTPEITVYYNNWQSSTGISCDWTQAIEIQGLSTITSTNTFTPYFNIDYIDENNQLLTESYSKDILYLSGTTFKKTYTWWNNNYWVLTSQSWNSESIFTWYVPVFDVSGTTQPFDTEYNMFNNFADNSLKVLLSNIPWYIQYVFIIWIILLLIWIVKMLKRRK